MTPEELSAIGCAACCEPLDGSGPVCECLIYHPCHVHCCSICAAESLRSMRVAVCIVWAVLFVLAILVGFGWLMIRIATP